MQVSCLYISYIIYTAIAIKLLNILVLYFIIIFILIFSLIFLSVYVFEWVSIVFTNANNRKYYRKLLEISKLFYALKCIFLTNNFNVTSVFNDYRSIRGILNGVKIVGVKDAIKSLQEPSCDFVSSWKCAALGKMEQVRISKDPNSRFWTEYHR